MSINLQDILIALGGLSQPRCKQEGPLLTRRLLFGTKWVQIFLGNTNSVRPQLRHTSSTGCITAGRLFTLLSPEKWMSTSAANVFRLIEPQEGQDTPDSLCSMGSEESILIGFSEVRFDKRECRLAPRRSVILRPRISGNPASDQEAGSAAAQNRSTLKTRRQKLTGSWTCIPMCFAGPMRYKPF